MYEEEIKKLDEKSSSLNRSLKKVAEAVKSVSIHKKTSPNDIQRLGEALASDTSGLEDYRVKILTDDKGQVIIGLFEAEKGSGLDYGKVEGMRSRTKGAKKETDFIGSGGKQGEMPKKRKGEIPTKDTGGNFPNVNSDDTGATLAEIVISPEGKAVGKVLLVSKPKILTAEPEVITEIPIATLRLNANLSFNLPEMEYVFGDRGEIVAIPVAGIGDIGFGGKGKGKGGQGKGDLPVFTKVDEGPVIDSDKVLEDIVRVLHKWELREIEFERQLENKKIEITWDRHLYDTYTEMRASGNPKNIIKTALGVVLGKYNKQNIYGIPKEGEEPPLLAYGKPLNYLGFELRTANLILPGAELWYAGQLIPNNLDFSYRLSAGYGVESSEGNFFGPAAMDFDAEAKWAFQRNPRGYFGGAAAGFSAGYSPLLFGRQEPEVRASFLLGLVPSHMLNNDYALKIKVGGRYMKEWVFDMSLSFTFYNPDRELPFLK